jgi:NAD(P)-dependent dehydrogenase (short-subunit alcohol dehydrogenase family)
VTLVDAHARKVAVVTGVGPGIGRSTALALAREGCDVVVAARSADYLDEVVGELEDLGAHGLAVPTDTGDVAQCRALVERAVERFDRLDVVVSSAAKGAPNHTIMHADLDDWEQAWLVNVLGPLELFRAAVPHLAAAGADSGHGSAIVAVSALAVRAINPGQGAYAATKAALTVAAQTLAREVGVDGIRVNVVVPGFVPGPNTEAMFSRIAERRNTTVEAVQEQMAAEHALRRLPTPDDIADAIVFLASERARSITGQTLDVNAGRWFA